MGAMFLQNLKAKAVGLAKKIKKIGMDDPRRIIHSLKVGLALTLVSIFYYVNPLYDGFGISTMWAVLTVVVVMEFTVGGTLGKGLNRAFGTLLAGALGVGAHYVANLGGEKGEPILLGCFVFLLAAAATFSRFIPEIKARYDYGVLIFILTFSLVAVSSYRVDELVELAHQRLSTIAIGGASCIIISLFLFPVWAGGDLHDLTARNLEKLSVYLEGVASVYLDEGAEIATEESKSFLQAYKSVLNSKTTEETLANLAKWEPGHGNFGFRHPWKQYLKVGAAARQCAYCLEALNAHIIKPETQVSLENCEKMRDACREMCLESSKALRELSLAIQGMTDPWRAKSHAAAAATAVSGLKAILMDSNSLYDILHAATVTSILSEVVKSTQKVTESTEELALLAGFKTLTAATTKATVKPISDNEESDHVTIKVEK